MSITPLAPPGYVLASNVAATGEWVLWPGGKGTFLVNATGTGTVKLQVMGPDGVTAQDVGTDTTITATTGGGNFELPKCFLRANIATFTAVYARVCRLPE